MHLMIAHLCCRLDRRYKDWSSPLLGVCSALGIDDTDGHVTTARPIRLGTVRNADGDSAEGDGLRREADG